MKENHTAIPHSVLECHELSFDAKVFYFKLLSKGTKSEILSNELIHDLAGSEENAVKYYKEFESVDIDGINLGRTEIKDGIRRYDTILLVPETKTMNKQNKHKKQFKMRCFIINDVAVRAITRKQAQSLCKDGEFSHKISDPGIIINKK